MSSQAYEAQVSAMYLKSLETEHNNSYKEAFDIFKQDKNDNETNKKIIEMLSQIILMNEKIYEKLQILCLHLK